jgi:transcription antitermination factor NusG
MAAHVLGHWTMRNVRGGQRQFWIVVATKSLAGRVAVSCITEQGYPNYQPEYRAPPVRGVRKTMPLFPGYMFVTVTLDNWRPVAYTRDVRRVIMMGERPAPLHRSEIERLRSLENEHGYIEPEFASPPQFKTGESVEATRGIFQDKFGQYVGLADQRGGHRVKVLFEIMGRQAEYEISAFDLAGTSLAA